MPPGHRMMPTDERLKTLQIMAESKSLIYLNTGLYVVVKRAG